MPRSLFLAFAATAILVCAACTDTEPRAIYSEGHADVRMELALTGARPAFDVSLSAGGATVGGETISGQVSLDDISIRSAARYARPGDDAGAFAPLCVETGDEISWLPQGLREARQNAAPFLGLAAEFEASAVTDGVVRLLLVDVRAPTETGAYSMWQDGFPPRFWMSSCDGVDASDHLDLAPGHDHYNMGFSEPGQWTVTYSVSAELVDTGETVSGDFEVHYDLE